MRSTLGTGMDIGLKAQEASTVRELLIYTSASSRHLLGINMKVAADYIRQTSILRTENLILR